MYEIFECNARVFTITCAGIDSSGEGFTFNPLVGGSDPTAVVSLDRSVVSRSASILGHANHFPPRRPHPWKTSDVHKYNIIIFGPLIIFTARSRIYLYIYIYKHIYAHAISRYTHTHESRLLLSKTSITRVASVHILYTIIYITRHCLCIINNAVTDTRVRVWVRAYIYIRITCTASDFANPVSPTVQCPLGEFYTDTRVPSKCNSINYNVYIYTLEDCGDQRGRIIVQ